MISSLSSYWHHIHLTTSALWAQIRLHGTKWRNRAAVWLKRSRCCLPGLSSWGANFNCIDRDLDRLFELHSDQFKSLVFDTGKGYNIGVRIFHTASTQYTEASVKLEFLEIIQHSNNCLACRMLALTPKNQMDRYLKSVRTLSVRLCLFD